MSSEHTKECTKSAVTVEQARPFCGPIMPWYMRPLVRDDDGPPGTRRVLRRFQLEQQQYSSYDGRGRQIMVAMCIYSLNNAVFGSNCIARYREGGGGVMERKKVRSLDVRI